MWSEMREKEEKKEAYKHLSTHSRQQRKKRHSIKKMGYHVVARARRRRRRRGVKRRYYLWEQGRARELRRRQCV
jgi:hypothetical protein